MRLVLECWRLFKENKKILYTPTTGMEESIDALVDHEDEIKIIERVVRQDGIKYRVVLMEHFLERYALEKRLLNSATVQGEIKYLFEYLIKQMKNSSNKTKLYNQVKTSPYFSGLPQGDRDMLNELMSQVE